MSDTKIPVVSKAVVVIAPDKKLESLLDTIHKMIALRSQGFSSEDPFESIFGKELVFTKEESLDSTSDSIEYLEISVHAYNCLRNAGVSTISQLMEKTAVDLLKTKFLGVKTLREIEGVLAEKGLSLRK